jgi:hypothetical protein
MMGDKTILGAIDPEITDALVSRRSAIAKGASMSSGLAFALKLGSMPVALAALSKDVYGQTPADVLDVLQFAFILENLEAEFYKAVLNSAGAGPQAAAFAPVRAQINALPNATRILATLDQIRKHEEAHVAFLRTAIQANGGTAPNLTGANFDFTGGNGSGNGPFAAATTNAQFLLAATQAFEDTGVRAYKGQAGRLINNDAVLEAALRIHSVEARHAGQIRNMRRDLNMTVEVLRYSGTIRGGGVAAAGADFLNPPPAVAAAFAAIYGGATPESNTSHTTSTGTFNAATLSGTTTIGTGAALTNAATEAFDEPLSKDEVIAIVRDFIVDGPGLP